jgi:hypothetical protein
MATPAACGALRAAPHITFDAPSVVDAP